jgi:hypothetical protein
MPIVDVRGGVAEEQDRVLTTVAKGLDSRKELVGWQLSHLLLLLLVWLWKDGCGGVGPMSIAH